MLASCGEESQERVTNQYGSQRTLKDLESNLEEHDLPIFVFVLIHLIIMNSTKVCTY